jgi:alpha-glucuronidase
MKHYVALVLAIIAFCSTPAAKAEDGYELWLRYRQVNPTLLQTYRKAIDSWHIGFESPTASVMRDELQLGLPALLGKNIQESTNASNASILFLLSGSEAARRVVAQPQISKLPEDGFLIQTLKNKNRTSIVVIGNSDGGVLYGMFHLLRILQTEQPINDLDVTEAPRYKVRILNHWDNLDRTVERGYAGFSIFDWHTLPKVIDQRYIDYARANASVGINGAVLTNVNANAIALTVPYLQKVKALADVFRPYHIKIYLTARFSAPVEIGKLKTSDPADPLVQNWWKAKAKEIYSLIPDFGGFLVKANSEGQPGPQTYGRTHAEGANVLADALKPFGGIVMWRAFVYDNEVKVDRAKQSYNEFVPLDGKFSDNVLLQVKNGPIDFQPREPFHPLFGSMQRTQLMPEFQITQEYLGFSTHLAYLGTLFKETLDADTYRKGPGTSVAKTTDVTSSSAISGIAGVANIGNDRNWCGHPFAQANWYAFARLAWNHEISVKSIAEEWIRMTWGNEAGVVSTCLKMMMPSREAAVNYMTPLGLHHIMGWDHHYGPGPWIKDKPRADWTSVYYHQADGNGIGFDRTAKGSNAVEQYSTEVASRYADPGRCPEELLLWFHHVEWDRKMRSGRSLWDELCYRYQGGVDSVKSFAKEWNALEKKIDKERFNKVSSLLKVQIDEAEWWRDACLLYFQQFAKRPVPADIPKARQSLQYYQDLEFPFAPGIRPKW